MSLKPIIGICFKCKHRECCLFFIDKLKESDSKDVCKDFEKESCDGYTV
jgi:hypothetical protein